MEDENSIAAELLQEINLTKLWPTPNYLSSADAMTIAEFEQSKYSEEYSLDVSNIEWGKTSNDSHVFNILSEFCMRYILTAGTRKCPTGGQKRMN